MAMVTPSITRVGGMIASAPAFKASVNVVSASAT
jgi:hypothetical protein